MRANLIMSKIKQLRTQVNELRGQQKKTKANKKEAEKRLSNCIEKIHNHEAARELLRHAGQQTQQTLAFHISDITSLALESVFGKEAYNLIVEFVQRRNKTECDLFFERDGTLHKPMSASGGGPVDVVSFALRVANWSMKNPRTRPVIILDEPMRFLSTGLQPKASDMIKQISKKLGIQFIIITHEAELEKSADKIFDVSIKNKITTVQEK